MKISHLNSKIVEDSEELASSERAAETMRENFHRQVCPTHFIFTLIYDVPEIVIKILNIT